MNNNNVAYIDGTNLHKATVKHGWMVDYAKLYIWLREKHSISRAYIFIGYIHTYEKLYSKMRSAGFVLIFKMTTTDRSGSVKGNCDSDLVLRAVRDVYEEKFDYAHIVSSDGDFSSLIDFLKEKLKMGSIISPSNDCSILLMRTGISITYLNELRTKLCIDSVAENKKAPDEDKTS